MSDQLLFSLGILLVFAGIVIALVAVILMFFVTMKGKGKTKGGGVVIIGPLPIVFGTDRESIKTLLLFSAALIIVALVTMVVFLYTLR